MRAQVTHELEVLREQQADFSNTLDALLEENDDGDEDEPQLSIKNKCVSSATHIDE